MADAQEDRDSAAGSQEQPLDRSLLERPDTARNIEEALRMVTEGRATPGTTAEDLRKLADARRAVDPGSRV